MCEAHSLSHAIPCRRRLGLVLLALPILVLLPFPDDLINGVINGAQGLMRPQPFDF